MLSSPDYCIVGRKMKQYGVTKLVVDPVMISKSGQELYNPMPWMAQARPFLWRFSLYPIFTGGTFDRNNHPHPGRSQASGKRCILGSNHVLIKPFIGTSRTDLLYDGRFFRL